MLCEYCNYLIESPILLNTTDVYILKLSTYTYCFCCEECRNRFIQEHSQNVKLDMFGQFIEE